MRYFSELDLRSIEPRTIILDVDGTILADGETRVSDEVHCAVARALETHEMYIFSNNRDLTRASTVARDLGVPCITSEHRKPDRRVLDGFTPRHALLVVGDKYLTDERFARAIGAEFLRVGRLRSTGDSLVSRLVYAMDDAVSFLMKSMKRRT